MSSKDSTKNLVGQPIFRQLIDYIPRNKVDLLVETNNSDRYYKTFSSWDHLVTMLFGILSRCDSMAELCDGMRGLEGKLNHLGMDKSPAKSTAGDGLRNRANDFFQQVYFMLLKHFESTLSVSHIDRVSFKKLFIFDSTTISLFSDVMKGVGRNPKNDGKKKGGAKVHMLTDAHSNSPKFVKISEAKLHDKNFLHMLHLPPHSMIVFDRAYNYYLQFGQWTEQHINFVCRMKKSAVYEVIETLYENELPKDKPGVLLEEHIHLTYKKGKVLRTLCLRKVAYRDEKGRFYEFITNNFEISCEEVALLYKLRWNIELMFKKLKQNFQLHYFYSETENGIKTQIWCTLIAKLLLQVLSLKSKSKKAFSTVAALIRIHLISNVEIIWMITNCKRSYTKGAKKTKPPPNLQASLF